jgi:hypothetical protein
MDEREREFFLLYPVYLSMLEMFNVSYLVLATRQHDYGIGEVATEQYRHIQDMEEM